LEFSLARLRAGSILAVGAGRYQVELRVPAGVTVWGACAEETALWSSIESREEAVVNVRAENIAVRNLAIAESERPGLLVEYGALDLSGVAIEGARNAGFLSMGGSSIDADGVVIRDMRTATDGRFGRGGVGQLGAEVSLRRASVEANLDVGLYAAGAGTSVRIDESVVRDTRPRLGVSMFGHGVGAEYDGRVEVSRSLVARNREIGVYGLVGGSVRLEQTVVSDTSMNDVDRWGRGIGIGLAANAELRDVLVARNHEVAVSASGEGTTLALVDVAIEDTESSTSVGRTGRGVSVQDGVSVEAQRLVIRSSKEAGIAIMLTSTANFDDVVVSDTRATDCTGTSCSPYRGGSGIGVYMASTGTATRFRVEGSDLCGVQVASTSSLVLAEGEVRDNAIGACLHVPDYDLGLVTDGVRYADNGVNLQTTDLPLPEPHLSVSVLMP
jgi:hypothetical protein